MVVNPGVPSTVGLKQDTGAVSSTQGPYLGRKKGLGREQIGTNQNRDKISRGKLKRVGQKQNKYAKC